MVGLETVRCGPCSGANQALRLEPKTRVHRQLQPCRESTNSLLYLKLCRTESNNPQHVIVACACLFLWTCFNPVLLLSFNPTSLPLIPPRFTDRAALSRAVDPAIGKADWTISITNLSGRQDKAVDKEECTLG
jgi:hypothetical protein